MQTVSVSWKDGRPLPLKSIPSLINTAWGYTAPHTALKGVNSFLHFEPWSDLWDGKSSALAFVGSSAVVCEQLCVNASKCWRALQQMLKGRQTQI